MIPDIPRLYTAIAEWAACMIYILVLKKRFKGVKFVAFSILSLGVFCGMQYLLGLLPISYWIPGMILAILLMFLCFYAVSKNSLLDTLFWTARAFVLAEFVASLEWQFHYYLTSNIFKNGNFWGESFFMLAIFGVVFIGSYFLERRYSLSNRYLKISRKDLIVTAVIAVVIFLISNISFINKNTPLSAKYASEIFYIRTLVDLCGLILFYAQQEQRLWLHAKHELDSMQNIMRRQYEQYCLSKENTELLNRKYHDLKHQIQIIKEEENPIQKAQYLEEMEMGIKMHEAQNKTGNNVLDTILTSKSLIFVENKINFTCVAEGQLLDFMEVMDICSIFGNALDNAIESLCSLKDVDKRLLKVAVFSQNNLLMIRFENYIESTLNFENGLPITTKTKKDEHGYGLKSIRSSAEKYDGTVKISTTDNWFSICLLIPIDKEE